MKRKLIFIFLILGLVSIVCAVQYPFKINTSLSCLTFFNLNTSTTYPLLKLDNSGNASLNSISYTNVLNLQNGSIAMNGKSVQFEKLHSYPRNNTLKYLATINDRGSHGSIIIGSDGLPLIVSRNGTGYDLSIIKCFDLNCNTFKDTFLAGTLIEMGRQGSIAVDTDGLPIVKYVNNSKVWIYKCSTLDCSKGVNRFIGAIGVPISGYNYPKIFINGDGNPFFFEKNVTSGKLISFRCMDINCSSTQRSIFGLVNYAYGSTGLLGSDGYPIISYVTTPGYINVTKCNNYNCSLSSSVKINAYPVQQYITMVIAKDGLPLLFFYNLSGVRSIKCNNLNCSSNTITNLGITGVGLYPDAKMLPSGLPIVISTSTAATYVSYMHCNNYNCSKAQVTKPTTQSSSFTSMTVGVDGLPMIVFQNSTQLNLGFIKCGSEFCLPYWTRR